MEHRAEHIAVDTAADTVPDHMAVDRKAADRKAVDTALPAVADIGPAVAEAADIALAVVEQPAAHSVECSEPADSG